MQKHIKWWSISFILIDSSEIVVLYQERSKLELTRRDGLLTGVWGIVDLRDEYRAKEHETKD